MNLKWLLWGLLPLCAVEPEPGVEPELEPEVEGESEPEPEVEPEPEGDPEPEPEPQAAKGRANEAVRAARERAQAAERRAQEVETELQRERSERQARDAAAQRERELADEKDLSYEERLYRHQLRKDKEVDQKLAATEARLVDQADRTAFEAKAASNPTFAKYASRVEEQLGNLRRAGQNAPRESILTFLVGKDALAPKTKASTEKAKAAAAARVAAARGEPMRARSDAARGGASKSKLDELEARLDGIPL